MADLFIDLFFTGMVRSTFENVDLSNLRGMDRVAHEYACRIGNSDYFPNVHRFSSRLPTLARKGFLAATGLDLLSSPSEAGLREYALDTINRNAQRFSTGSGTTSRIARKSFAGFRKIASTGLFGDLYFPKAPDENSVWLSISTLFTPNVRSLGGKRVMICHDLNHVFHYREMGLSSPELSPISNQALTVRNDEWVVCVSEYSRKCFLEYHPNFPPDQAFVNPLGADVHTRKHETSEEEILQKYGVSSGSFFFTLAAGALHKNSAYLIEEFVAWKRDCKDSNGVKLILAGAGQDSITSRLSPAARDRVLDGEVVFTGYLPDAELPVFYRHSKAFVFASLAEGFGLPPLEAMGRGAAVICSNRTSLPEVVGDAGLLFDPGINGALTQAMADIHRSPTLRAELSQKGKARANLYTWDRSSTKLLEILEMIGKEPKGRN